MRIKFARYLLALLLILLALSLASCSESSAQAEPGDAAEVAPKELDQPTPTPTPLPLVVAADSGRFEIFLEISTEFMQLGNRSIPVIKGEWDGKGTAKVDAHMQRQLGALETIISSDEGDLKMEMIHSLDRSYAHAPFAGATRAAFQDTESPYIKDHPMRGEFVDIITDSWAYVDHAVLGQLSDSGEPLAPISLIGIDSLFYPQTLLDALYDVSPVDMIGTSEVRGIEMVVYGAEVPFTDWISFIAGGPLNVDFGQSISIQEESAMLELEFYVDTERNLHRIRGRGTAVTVQNQSDVTEQSPGTSSLRAGDISVLLGSETVDVWLQVDLFDHGGDIVIDFPEDPQDVAYLFEELFEIVNE